MQAPKELQDQIEALIKPWSDTDKKPPFSIAQMIVMCLVLNKPVDKFGILTWLTTRIGYLRQFAVNRLGRDLYWENAWHIDQHSVHQMRSEVREALKTLMFPW